MEFSHKLLLRKRTATGTLFRGGPPDLLSRSEEGLVLLLKPSLIS